MFRNKINAIKRNKMPISVQKLPTPRRKENRNTAFIGSDWSIIFSLKKTVYLLESRVPKRNGVTGQKKQITVQKTAPWASWALIYLGTSAPL